MHSCTQCSVDQTRGSTRTTLHAPRHICSNAWLRPLAEAVAKQLERARLCQLPRDAKLRRLAPLRGRLAHPLVAAGGRLKKAAAATQTAAALAARSERLRPARRLRSAAESARSIAPLEPARPMHVPPPPPRRSLEDDDSSVVACTSCALWLKMVLEGAWLTKSQT